jgi:tetratricopeptide (TPR) repeat protein
VWSKEDVAKRIDKEYVAVLIDVDKDEGTPKLYDVSAMPTLVIADADGFERAKSVGAPFSTPEGAIKWFDEIGGKITAYDDLNAKWNESKHTDTGSGEKLAEAAIGLGKTTQAIEIYEALIAAAGEDKVRAATLNLKVGKLLLDQWEIERAAEFVDKADKLAPAEGDARVDVDVVRARVLLFSEKGKEARELANKYFDKLVEKADARALDLADIMLTSEDEQDEATAAKKGRALYLKLAKAFDKHERVWELKVYAAWYGLSGDEKEACRKELAEVAEKGEGQWKDIAKSLLEEKDEEGKEEKKEDGEDEMG